MTPDLYGRLRFGPLGQKWVHLCIDMQRMFAEPTEWHTPWIERVLPNVISLIEVDPARTIFTRFITPQSPEEVPGAWRNYYTRWRGMNRDKLDPELLELVPELARFVPPAKLHDKPVMSAWHGNLHSRLADAGIGSIVVTGGESEVCVLASVMGAVDLGYRVVVVTDALYSSADSTHDAVLHIYESRFGMQIETITTAELLAARLEGLL